MGPTHAFDMMGAEVPVFDAGLGSFPSNPAPRPLQPRVSADELRHPMTEKARRILLKAWNYAVKGDHSRAIATIQEGMAKVRSFSTPYGHGFLGIEYVRTGRPKEAVTELSQSLEFFPHDAPGHSNLAVSLCLTGDLETAEREAKVALYLEPTLSSAAEIVTMIEEYKAKFPPRLERDGQELRHL